MDAKDCRRRRHSRPALAKESRHSRSILILKTRNGFVSGSSQSLSLSITVFDDGQATLDYNAALAAAIAAAPASILGATLDTSDVAVADRSHDSIVFSFDYTRPSSNTLLLSDGAQTKAKKLHHFVAPVGVYDSGGDATSSFGNLKWKLDRQGSAAEFNSGKPVTVDPLPVGPRFTFNTSQSFVTDSYVDTVKDLVDRGVFNDAIFLGRAIGTLQIVEFAVNQRDANDWELVFGFGYRAFRASVSVGDGVVIPELRGCDYYWPVEVETYASGSIQPKVKAVVVGQAWEFGDFSLLNLPYQGTLTAADTVTTIYAHDLTASDDAILFWEGGTRTANITGVGANTITFSGGSGDALPPVGTKVLIAKYIP